MTFAREVLDSKQFQSIVDGLKDLINEDGALTIDEWKKEDTRVLYELGYNLYKNKEYNHAESIFRKLVVMMPLEKTHWQGLASTIQMQRRFQDALVAWSMFAFIDPKCPMPHFFAAECLFELDNFTDCMTALNALSDRDPDGQYNSKTQSMKEMCMLKLEEVHD